LNFFLKCFKKRINANTTLQEFGTLAGLFFEKALLIYKEELKFLFI